MVSTHETCFERIARDSAAPFMLTMSDAVVLICAMLSTPKLRNVRGSTAGLSLHPRSKSSICLPKGAGENSLQPCVATGNRGYIEFAVRKRRTGDRVRERAHVQKLVEGSGPITEERRCRRAR